MYVIRLRWWLRDKESSCNAENTSLILGLERSPGEENASPSHYSIWKIPWTEEEPGRPQSMGLQKESGMTWQLNSKSVITQVAYSLLVKMNL